VRIQADVFAEDHPLRLASQHALAIAYEANGQIKETVQLLEYIVRIKADVLAEDHPSRLASQHELARAYHADEQVTQAIELLEHVVSIRADVLAEDHPHRLLSETNLAVFHKALVESSETGQSSVPSVQDLVVEDGNSHRPNRAHESSQVMLHDRSESTAVLELASADRELDSSRMLKSRVLVSRLKGMFGKAK
jgi:tetratricopeptide (TPR) repeat protein